MKLAEIGHDLRRFWRALDRLSETPILDLEKKLVVPDGPFDYLGKLSRRSSSVRALVKTLGLTNAEIYDWQAEYSADIKLLWCLLELISWLERSCMKVGIFLFMLKNKNNLGMLWNWDDFDTEKLSNALAVMNDILYQAGVNVRAIIASHRELSDQVIPPPSPEIKELVKKLYRSGQITMAEVITALGKNPALLNLTLPTGAEQLCNLMVNNTLDFFEVWLWAFKNVILNSESNKTTETFIHYNYIPNDLNEVGRPGYEMTRSDWRQYGQALEIMSRDANLPTRPYETPSEIEIGEDPYTRIEREAKEHASLMVKVRPQERINATRNKNPHGYGPWERLLRELGGQITDDPDIKY